MERAPSFSNSDDLELLERETEEVTPEQLWDYFQNLPVKHKAMLNTELQEIYYIDDEMFRSQRDPKINGKIKESLTEYFELPTSERRSRITDIARYFDY